MRKKIVFAICLLVVITAYFFLYLGIELDLKNVVELRGMKDSRLINTSFKIRNFASVQLLLFLALSTVVGFYIIKKRV